MSTELCVVSWNVEHLGATAKSGAVKPELPVMERLSPLLDLDPAPDVIALYEVEGKEVWREVMAGFPGYSFFITEGQNTQQILVGLGPEVTAFLTQKVEFKEYNPFLRPGAFITVQKKGATAQYTLLFLHLKSMMDPGGFGGRTEMIDLAFKFKHVLEDAAKRPVNYLFCGDMNTMGLDYPFARKADRHLEHDTIQADHEVSRLSYLAADNGMRLLTKSAPATWADPGDPGRRSNLDHVVATDGITFADQGGSDVRVLGWPELPVDQQPDWILKHSDHGLLYFKIEA